MFITYLLLFFFFKLKTAIDVLISDWSSDVCSSDLQMSKIKIQANIVGWGHTAFGKLSGDTIESLIASAAKQAIVHAGIDPRDIDAVWLGHFNSGMVPDAFCSSMVLGAHDALRFKPATRCEHACASGSEIGRAHV